MGHVVEQRPATHVSPAEHAAPQTPQLVGSLCNATQRGGVPQWISS
jgi:hypothetical protein